MYANRMSFSVPVAAEGSAVEDQRGPGLYSESLSSLSAADMERQREAPDEDSHT